MRLIFFISLFSFILAFSPIDTNANDLDQKRKVKGCLTHVVNHGETLSGLIRQYQITIEDLKEYNPNIEHEMGAGTILYIPRKKIGKASEGQLDRDLTIAAQIEAKNAPKKEVVDQPKEQELGEKVVTQVSRTTMKEHTVVAKETFYSISKKYEITVEDIRKANPTVAQNDMSIGTILNIPVTELVDEVSYVGAVSDNNEVSEEPTPVVMDIDPRFADREPLAFNSTNKALKISLLLPLKDEQGKTSSNFLSFYQGFLVGLDSLKNEGISMELNVINVDKDGAVIPSVISSGELDKSDIIIGPVYDDQFSKVATYAESRNIPIVSPLGSVSCSGDNVFQVAPIEETKYDKLRDVVRGKNVTLLTTDNDDAEFVDKMKEMVGDSLHIVPFDAKRTPESYVEALGKNNDNIYLVASTDPMIADAMISKVRMIRMFATAKRVRTIASPRIARMSSINPANLFSADVSYVTSYHADRTNGEVKTFDNRYMSLFGDAPSLYSYRGYDVALFFLGSLKEFDEDFYECVEDYYTTILQVTYYFVKDQQRGIFVNKEWMYVNYTPSYDIIVD